MAARLLNSFRLILTQDMARNLTLLALKKFSGILIDRRAEQAALDERHVREAAEEREAEHIPSPSQLLADLQREIKKIEAELDDKTLAYAQRPRRKAINASTREHIYAAYMEAWRRKVERVGNLNYPKGHMGDVVVHVAVRSDGSVEKMRIMKHADSSLINESALKIATLAAPFPPFPAEIREKTDILDIIRTWRFVEETKEMEVD